MKGSSNLFDIVKELLDQVKSIGVENFTFGSIGESIRAGKPAFDETTLQEHGVYKLAIKFFFGKDEHDKYGLKIYRLTMYDPDPVDWDFAKNSGLPIRELDERMRKADWYFDLAENNDQWVKGYKEVSQIEEELRELTHHPVGKIAAAYLWNNHVPIVAVEKPAFIRRIEHQLGLYPQHIFTADTQLAVAIQRLKDYRQVENSLSSYEILEFKSVDEKSSIIHKILDGEKQLLTLERNVVPAEHIEKYLVFTHDYPLSDDASPLNTIGKRLKEVGSSPEFDGALRLLHSKAAELIKEKPASYNWDIMVVGKYQGMELEFNFEGTPEPNTGHILATAYPTNRRYDVLLSEDLNKNIKVHDCLYVQLDGDSGKLVFSDVLKGQKEIDSRFWNKEASLPASDQLLSEGKSRKTRKATTEKEMPECLLPKTRTASERGKTIK